MNGHFSLGLFLFVLFFWAGCDDPQQQRQRQRASSDIEGIKLSDLRAEQHPEIESLLSFFVLTYVLDTDSLESLETVIDSLSQRDIRYDNAAAFEANGFTVGFGSHQAEASIAQKLRSIEAVRINQGTLGIPSGFNEILYSTDVSGPTAIIYSTSSTGAGGTTVETGKLGWIISAEQKEASPDVVQVMLCPAFWKMGARDIRLMMGQDPYDYQFFDVGRIHFEMEAGQFCLLGPERIVRDQDTLDRILFEVPGREKVRFFVIILGGRRQTDGDGF